MIPSFLNMNFSFNKIGDSIAEKTIVMQEVEAMRIMFPSPRANAFII